MQYSIVIPCYKSAETIGQVVKLLCEEFDSSDFEIILVNDGSPDKGATSAKIISLAKEYTNIIAIDLAKNSGQHNATLCGFNYASGEYIIVMDDDLQTRPNQIGKLISKINEGYDVVYANYPEKKQKWYRNLGSAFSGWSVSKMIGKPRWLKTSSFWICRKFVRDYAIQYKNENVFMPGLVLRVTANIGVVQVEHFERAVGKSGYTLKTLIKLWSNIIGFSVKPLRIASVLGFSFSIVGFIGVIIVVVRKLFCGVNVTGWSSMMAVICLFSGMILACLGILGEYIGRMFLGNGNQPQSVIRSIKGGRFPSKIDHTVQHEVYECMQEGGE